MAISNTTVVEVRTTGNDNNGGAYDPGQAGAGTDYSLQDAAQLSLSDLACVAASTTLTSATGGFTSAMIGNHIQLLAGGTNVAPGFYKVTGYTNTNTVTIDRTCASGGGMSGTTGNLGGALATPGKAAGFVSATSGIDVWLKAGTYSITSTTPNVAGGRVNMPAGGVSNTSPSCWRAYSVTRGDQAGRATLLASGISTTTLFDVNTRTYIVVDGIICDGAGLTSIRGFGVGSQGRYLNCKAVNCKNVGFNSPSYAQNLLLNCEADSCSIGFSDAAAGINAYINCYAHHCTAQGFSLNDHHVAVHCTAHGNTGDGFAGAFLRYNCTSHGNGGDGFEPVTYTHSINCLAQGNTGYGFSGSSAIPLSAVIYCATRGNGAGGIQAGVFTGAEMTFGNLALSADALVDPTNHDFDLNATAGGGAALAGTGYPQNLPGAASTTPRPSIGYSPPAAGGSGGGGPLLGPGRMVRS